MKFCVIGLGRFGYNVATVLADNGMEVMAIDKNEDNVSAIKDQVTQAICLKITGEKSLRSIGVDEMDTVIVAMGESFAESILITALLKKKLHLPRVITRAVSDIHKDILKLVGADRVILPEKEIGIRVADNLSSSFTDLNRLSKDFSISQIVAPKHFVGKTIASLDMFSRFRVHIIGIKNSDESISSASPSHVIKDKERLIIAGNNDDLEKISTI